MKQERTYRRILSASLSLLLAIGLWGCQTAPDPSAAPSTSASGTATPAQKTTAPETTPPATTAPQAPSSQPKVEIHPIELPTQFPQTQDKEVPFVSHLVKTSDQYSAPLLATDSREYFKSPAIIRSYEELRAYLSDTNPYYDCFGINEALKISLKNFDASYFQDRMLVLMRMSSPGLGWRYEVSKILSREDGTFSFFVQATSPTIYCTAPDFFHLIVELPSDVALTNRSQIRTTVQESQHTDLAFSAQYVKGTYTTPIETPEQEALYNTPTVIKSVEELNDYLSPSNPNYALFAVGDSLSSACQKYDQTYFKDRVLVLLRACEENASITPRLTSVRKYMDTYPIQLYRLIPYTVEQGTTPWHILLELEADCGITSGEQIDLTVFKSSTTTLSCPAEIIPGAPRADMTPTENNTFTRASLIHSVEELNAYLAQENHTLYSINEEVISALRKYDGAYFKDHFLVIKRFTEDDSTTTVAINKITYSNNYCGIYLDRFVTNHPSPAKQTYHIIVELTTDIQVQSSKYVNLITSTYRNYTE